MTAPTRLAIAAPATGCGKTAVAVGLMRALRRRGHRVQPFKAGPDFIDAGHHTAASGRPSRNLDTWMLPPATLGALFARAAAGADLAIVEGVMGLFDGLWPASDAASTADVCRQLGLPILGVLDGYTAARTLAAQALGLVRADDGLRFAGFIVNRLGPSPYADALRTAITELTGLPVFGTVAAHPAIAVPERHLGLRPAAEGTAWVEAAADAVEAGVDLQALLAAAEAAAPARPPRPPSPLPAPWPGPPRARLAVAMDQAFHFYYRDALDLLTDLGLECVPWSPLRDADLPPDVDGVYLGGGYPELHAAALSANSGARAAVARAAAEGLPVWGECGGFMYLCRELVDLEGRVHPMAGVVPARAVMTERLAGMGYREARARRDQLLMAAGETARGHEFHHSRAEWVEAVDPAWDLRRPAPGSETPDGYAVGNVLAGYVHLHLCGAPALAQRLVSACAGARARRRPDPR